MARKVLLESYYTFNPATRTVVLPRVVQREKLLLITNVTTNQVIYNFSDPNLKATSYSVDGESFPPSTTVVLNYNTTSMSSTDKLQFVIDEFEERIVPGETLVDAVQKMRVAPPQSLIDTDFEYGVQPSKWEAVEIWSNYPSFYAKGTGGNSLELFDIASNGANPSVITVTTVGAHGLLTGEVVSVQETTDARAEGTFVITGTASTTFTYQAKSGAAVAAGSIKFGNLTSVYGGAIFDNAHIGGGLVGSFSGIQTFTASVAAADYNASASVVTVSMGVTHGLLPGTPILISETAASMNGNWVIKEVSTPNTFKFTANTGIATGNIGISTPTRAAIYAKSEGYVQHRAFDGGVLIANTNNICGAQTIRQTRRYFRYQSGKAIQFSTGAKLTPTYNIDTISAASATGTAVVVTINTQQDHGLQVGATVKIEGIEVYQDQNPYNGTFKVQTVANSNQFTINVNMNAVGGITDTTDLTPGGSGEVTAVGWKGAFTRTGLFDELNGFYFEYDGEQLYAAKRTCTQELFGKCTVTQYNNTVSGTSTRFRKQLIVGDYVSIKGQAYKVLAINSDTELKISPAYRGPSSTNVRMVKRNEIKVPQSEWNIDRCDGTGPSGYNLDVSKMQMVYIDYTWYGAGFIRFGFRAIGGDIIYVHRIQNNNLNSAAYMRSGNLPARYEVSHQSPYTRLLAGGQYANGEYSTDGRGAAFNSSDNVIYVENIDQWHVPDTTDSTDTNYLFISDDKKCEILKYVGIGSYDGTIKGYPVRVERSATQTTVYSGANFALTGYNQSGVASAFYPDLSIPRTAGVPALGAGVTNSSQVSVAVITQNCAPAISHWGSSVIMDGRYDEDKVIIFTAGMNRSISVASNATRPLMALRIAPSVDNGIARNFGVRELVNRMQLVLRGLQTASTGSFLIEGILNPSTFTTTTNGSVAATYPDVWATTVVGSGSLSQIIYCDNTSNSVSSTAVSAASTFTGGDKVFSFYTEASSGTNVTNFDLTIARDLGTSILSGAGSTTTPGFPNGPDVLLITARNLTGSASSIAARLSWTEAQA